MHDLDDRDDADQDYGDDDDDDDAAGDDDTATARRAWRDAAVVDLIHDRMMWSDDGWSDDDDDDDDVDGTATARAVYCVRLTATQVAYVARDAMPPRGSMVSAAMRGATEGHVMHAPLVHASHHAPPQSRAFLSTTVCNCLSRRLAATCVVRNGGLLCEFIEEERALAEAKVDDLGRDTNNLCRKYCYRRGAAELGFLRIRRQLPDCFVAAVRRVWPSATGMYMGYHAA